jgi:hypothetical protein
MLPFLVGSRSGRVWDRPDPVDILVHFSVYRMLRIYVLYLFNYIYVNISNEFYRLVLVQNRIRRSKSPIRTKIVNDQPHWFVRTLINVSCLMSDSKKEFLP